LNSQFTIFTLFSLLTINGYAESWPKTFDAPQAKYEETELRLITMMSSNDWDKDTIMNKDSAYAKYASSLLLCHYLIELSSRKFEGMKIFLDASWNDYSNFQIKRNKKTRVDQSILWGDKSVSKVEFQILQYWKSKRLKIKFIDNYKSN
jgi:hypothetical protein